MKSSTLMPTQIRPFTSSTHNLGALRQSRDLSKEEDLMIENELRRIEEKLERGSLNHVKNVLDKAKNIKTTNEVADRIAYEAKLKRMEEEEKNLNTYVQKFVSKHNKVKEVKEELKVINDINRQKAHDVRMKVSNQAAVEQKNMERYKKEMMKKINSKMQMAEQQKRKQL
jgi:phage-related tail protein